MKLIFVQVKLKWEPTDRLDRIRSGRETDDEVAPTTLENVERFQARQAERVRELAEQEKQN